LLVRKNFRTSKPVNLHMGISNFPKDSMWPSARVLKKKTTAIHGMAVDIIQNLIRRQKPVFVVAAPLRWRVFPAERQQSSKADKSAAATEVDVS
jgi:hypothetical protein